MSRHVLSCGRRAAVGPERVRPPHGGLARGPQSGVVLLATLVILLVVGISSASFVWFMNQQQSRAGARLRSAAAAAAAEAGVHRVLAIFEASALLEGAGRAWRPRDYSETLEAGGMAARFTVTAAEAPGGTIVLMSTGEAGGAVRRLRARVRLASPALLAGIYGTSIVRLAGPPSATFVVPYGRLGDLRWIHIASGQGVWMASTSVSLNEPGARPAAGPGPADAPGPPGRVALVPRGEGLRVLLAEAADFRVDDVHQPLDATRLWAMGFPHAITVGRQDALPAPPAVDRALYQAWADANVANSDVNRAVGVRLGEATLEGKSGSRYTAEEFQSLLDYLAVRSALPPLRGVVYVTGPVRLRAGQRLRIVDGALVTEGRIHVEADAVLEVTHGAGARTLPAILALDEGELLLDAGARLRAHGLVYVTRVFELTERADAEVVGGIVSTGQGFSFVNAGGRAVIRYDPAVLGTPGLLPASGRPVVTWVVAWEDVP